MIDKFGRRINYARISITDLCNLRCKYCMPEEGVTKKDCKEILRIEDFITIVRVLAELGIDKIRLTGGEPLVRRGLLSLADEIGSIKEFKDFAITTNGILLPKFGKDLRKAGVKRVNISLDTLNPEKYRDITRGGDLSQVLAGLDTALNEGFEKVKINVVLIKGFNEDEIEKFVNMTRNIPIDVRFIELMPFVGQQNFAFGKYIPGTSVLNRCKDLIPLKREDASSPAKYYKLPDAKGKVGLIEPLSHQFCDKCNRLRITADGHLLNCLHSRKETDLREKLNDPEGLKSLIIKAVNEKPETHHISEGRLMERDMGNIGG